MKCQKPTRKRRHHSSRLIFIYLTDHFSFILLLLLLLIFNSLDFSSNFHLNLNLNLQSRDDRGDLQLGRRHGIKTTAPGGLLSCFSRGGQQMPILRVDGPHSAPAEHYRSYKTVSGAITTGQSVHQPNKKNKEGRACRFVLPFLIRARSVNDDFYLLCFLIFIIVIVGDGHRSGHRDDPLRFGANGDAQVPLATRTASGEAPLLLDRAARRGQWVGGSFLVSARSKIDIRPGRSRFIHSCDLKPHVEYSSRRLFAAYMKIKFNMNWKTQIETNRWTPSSGSCT